MTTESSLLTGATNDQARPQHQGLEPLHPLVRQVPVIPPFCRLETKVKRQPHTVGLDSSTALTLDFSRALSCRSESTSSKETWYLRAAPKKSWTPHLPEALKVMPRDSQSETLRSHDQPQTPRIPSHPCPGRAGHCPLPGWHRRGPFGPQPPSPLPSALPHLHKLSLPNYPPSCPNDDL